MSGHRIGIIALGLTTTFYLFEFISRIEPGLAIETIAVDLNLSHGSVGTLSSIFFWIYAPMQLIVGILLDRYGARRTIVPAIAICSLGVLIFGLSQEPAVAAIGRLFTGFGASFAFVGALYVITHNFAPNRFAFLSGLVNAVGMLGTAVGAVLLTNAINMQGWRSVFITTGLVGLALLIVTYLFLTPDRQPDANQAPNPIFAGLNDIVSSQRVWIVAIAGALYFLPVNVFGGLWGQSDLINDHGLAPLSAELAVSMIFFGMGIGSVGAGALSDRLGHRKWIFSSNAALSGLAYALAIYLETSSVIVISGALLAAGVLGGAQMLTYAMVKEGRSAAEAGKVIAFVNMIGVASAVLFQPLVGGLIDLTDGNYRWALLVVPVCPIVAAILILSVDEHCDHRL